jgi:hypothetical protein
LRVGFRRSESVRIESARIESARVIIVEPALPGLIELEAPMESGVVVPAAAGVLTSPPLMAFALSLLELPLLQAPVATRATSAVRAVIALVRMSISFFESVMSQYRTPQHETVRAERHTV